MNIIILSQPSKVVSVVRCENVFGKDILHSIHPLSDANLVKSKENGTK